MRIVKWVFGLPVVVLVLLAVVSKFLPGPPRASQPPSAATLVVQDGLALERVKFRRSGDRIFVSGLVANKNAFSVRDVTILCEAVASSGTVLGRHSFVAYVRVIGNNGAAEIPDVGLGPVHGQTAAMDCRADRAFRTE